MIPSYVKVDISLKIKKGFAKLLLAADLICALRVNVKPTLWHCMLISYNSDKTILLQLILLAGQKYIRQVLLINP